MQPEVTTAGLRPGETGFFLLPQYCSRGPRGAFHTAEWAGEGDSPAPGGRRGQGTCLPPRRLHTRAAGATPRKQEALRSTWNWDQGTSGIVPSASLLTNPEASASWLLSHVPVQTPGNDGHRRQPTGDPKALGAAGHQPQLLAPKSVSHGRVFPRHKTTSRSAVKAQRWGRPETDSDTGGRGRRKRAGHRPPVPRGAGRTRAGMLLKCP